MDVNPYQSPNAELNPVSKDTEHRTAARICLIGTIMAMAGFSVPFVDLAFSRQLSSFTNLLGAIGGAIGCVGTIMAVIVSFYAWIVGVE